MLHLKNIAEQPSLQSYNWPPVKPAIGVNERLSQFIAMRLTKQTLFLNELYKNDQAQYNHFINKSLAVIYAYIFGYPDSPLYIQSNTKMEIQLQKTKLVLEEHFFKNMVVSKPFPVNLNQTAAADHLAQLIEDNTGIHHKFFDYIQHEMSKENLQEFLLLEVIRNEVVDDEVALAVVGLQGHMKQVMASNLWDECGCGDIKNFHTYWLRLLLEQENNWEKIIHYRNNSSPWFSSITSNTFNAFLTRPGFKYRAYGTFLINESWVAKHFEQILQGLERAGLDHKNITIYFDRHCRIDPNHTEQLVQALYHQIPVLSNQEINEVLCGAYTAIAAGTLMYDHLLKYFKAKDNKD